MNLVSATDSRPHRTSFPHFFTLLILSICVACQPEQPKAKNIAAVAPDLLFARAQRDISQSRWYQAKHALEQMPKERLEAQLFLAHVHFVLGDDQKAKDLYTHILQQTEDSQIIATCHFNLGLLAKKSGDLAKTQSHLEQAKQLRPQHADTWFHLGELFRQQGLFDPGAKAYRRAHQGNPNDATAVLGEVLCQLKLQHSAAALQALQRATRGLRNHPSILTLKARLAAIHLDPKQALEFAKSINIDADPQDRHEALALSHAAQGDFPKAIEHQTKAIELLQAEPSHARLPMLKEWLKKFQANTLPETPFHPEDPLFSQASLDENRETPFGIIPVWRQPHRSMKARLQAFHNSPTGVRNAYRNDLQARRLSRQLQLKVPAAKKQQIQFQLALEHLRSGDTQQALRELDTLESVFKQAGSQMVALQRITYLKALAYLRLAEQENCLLNHTAASCIYPIEKAGFHQLKTGAEAAKTHLEQFLAKQPGHLSARWLLNLAYMVLGEYPQGVPGEYLLELQLQDSEPTEFKLKDIAGSVGLDSNGLAGGSLVEDLDGDGFLDVAVSSWGALDPLRIFKNRGDGSFEDVTEGSGLEGITGGLNLLQTDFDNDGLKDILVLRGAWLDWAGMQPNSLLRNKGDFQFEDVTESSGLLSFHPTQTAVWLDFDNDGWLDLFIGNETVKNHRHPAELFHNQGDGTFIEIATEVGLDVTGFMKGVTAGDMDNDGLTDLYISRYQELNLLFKNLGEQPKGSFKFQEIAALAGVQKPKLSFPTWFLDYDNDGWLDLFVADYNNFDVGAVVSDFLGHRQQGEPSKLYRNLGDGRFEDVTQSAGLDHMLVAMGSNFGDLNNDGFLDFYVGTGSPNLSMLIPNRMLLNQGNGQFTDITLSSGLGHLQKGHGVSFADLDHDGDQDIFTVMGGAYSGDLYRNALFENPGNTHAWLILELVGKQANRAAIGARIEVAIRTSKGTRTVYRTVNSGGSFGASPLRQHLGLGDAESIAAVRILWPGSTSAETYENLGMNHGYQIVQGDKQPRMLDLPKIEFAAGKDHQHH